MATIAEGGLFPAIIDAYAPAITAMDLTTSGITVLFDINYNNPTDIRVVHLSLTRQSNYHSALDKNNYYRGVYVTKGFFISGTSGATTIPYSALGIEELSYNEYYKLQVRLSSDTVYPAGGYTKQNLSDYLTNENNLTHFSEWSTVCLVRFISEPSIILKANGQDVIAGGARVTLDSSNVTLAGDYETTISQTNPFMNQKDEEFLSKYSISVYDSNSEKVFDSGLLDIDLNNLNQFNYIIPYYFTNGNYQIRLDIETCNLHLDTLYFNIAINYDSNSWGGQSIVQEMFGINNILGKANITFVPYSENTTVPAGGKFVVRRGSDKDNFAIWEEVYRKTLTEPLTGTDSISFDDFTLESGNLYKYEITYISPTNISGHKNFTIVEGPAMTIFDHAFLTGEGTQLCVKFNPNVSGLQINVVDNSVTTIGGQYPYITRNGNMYYRSFSLSGTIAYEMDVQHQFASRSDIYQDWIQVYGSYFVNHYMNQQNDRVTQRKFRERVMSYLYNDVPKLFRSTPEGNILVRLTNVTLSPNAQLGRLVCDFSCTATEIGEASIENCKMYQIQDFGD